MYSGILASEIVVPPSLPATEVVPSAARPPVDFVMVGRYMMHNLAVRKKLAERKKANKRDGDELDEMMRMFVQWRMDF